MIFLRYRLNTQKNITGIGLTSKFFNNKLSNVFTFKRFGITAISSTPTIVNYGKTESLTDENYGIGNSLKYKFNNYQYVRLSYEEAARIPNVLEYFGDSELDIIGNTILKPERSHNLNFSFNTHLNSSQTTFLDVNTFYRFIEDSIILKSYSLLVNQYQNTDDTKILRGELAVKSNPIRQFGYIISVTYQDIRRKNIENVGDFVLGNRFGFL